MKRMFKYALLFVAAMVLTTGMTSCSDSDDDNADRVKEQNETLEAVTRLYLNAVVYPTYTSLANSADELYNLIFALKTKVNGGQPGGPFSRVKELKEPPGSCPSQGVRLWV